MLLRILLSALIGFWLAAGGAQAAERVALVIGNGGYQHVQHLINPRNDAGDIADSLQRLGFAVTRLTDATYDDMQAGLRDFAETARGAEIAIVFFAGHGMEISGRNWLIPIDATLHSDTDIDKEAIAIDAMMQSVDQARFGLIILDACRDNPFAAKMVQTKAAGRAITRGLAPVRPKGNLLVAYAARDGTTASDGGGRNSPFSGALLRNLETPGLEVGRLFRRVRDAVIKETRGGQQPFTYDGLASRQLVYLRPPAPPPDPASSECDRLAAAPDDKDKPAAVAGVELEKLDALAALGACAMAIKGHPETARFYFQQGRAAWNLKSYTQAHELFAKASGLGSGAAAYDLGIIYLNGLDSQKDEAKARFWLQRGVELGEIQAMATLGQLYSLEPDRAHDAQAYELFVKAATEDPVAMNGLGTFYETGRQVSQDPKTAYTWYERAAALGNKAAMRNLGSLFERGAGMKKKDLSAAKSWYEKAAAAGDEESKKRLQAFK